MASEGVVFIVLAIAVAIVAFFLICYLCKERKLNGVSEPDLTMETGQIGPHYGQRAVTPLSDHSNQLVFINGQLQPLPSPPLIVNQQSDLVSQQTPEEKKILEEFQNQGVANPQPQNTTPTYQIQQPIPPNQPLIQSNLPAPIMVPNPQQPPTVVVVVQKPQKKRLPPIVEERYSNNYIFVGQSNGFVFSFDNLPYIVFGR